MGIGDVVPAVTTLIVETPRKTNVLRPFYRLGWLAIWGGWFFTLMIEISMKICCDLLKSFLKQRLIVLPYMLEKHGFKVLEQQHFGEHSIFYATEKTGRSTWPVLSNHYNLHKQLFLDFVHYYVGEVNRLNALIDSFAGETYLFGAHIFSQFLIHQGLRASRIERILDNSPTKTGKRLYGTSLFVDTPQAIAEKQPVAVIVKAGGYQREVTEQLMAINANALIWT